MPAFMGRWNHKATDALTTFPFAHLLKKHLCRGQKEGEGVFCLQLQREMELADTAVFYAKKLGNLETEGHLRQGPAAGLFPCLLPRSC